MWLTRFLPILFGLFSSFAQAAAPAGETWFTLQTPHFRVHHTAPLETYARHFAFSLERTLPALEKSLLWQAPTPIDIIITDPSDSANGLAANFPNTHIEVYAAPLESDSVLAYYIDWVDELATHELTHIIANDTTLSYYLALRKVFGSWVKPNGLQSVWLIEGLAVYQETALTAAGRGRSPWMEALLRESVHAHRLTARDYTSIDRLSDGNPWWPGGSTAYLMGYGIQALGAGERANLPGEFSYGNAERLPFRPNANLEGLLQKDWSTLWREAPAKLEARYGKEARDQEAPCFLTQAGRHTGGHSLSPDGWLYFSEESFEHGHHLARVKADAPCDNREVERLYHKEHGGPTQVAVSDDGGLVAFSAFNHDKFERLYSDIYVWDRERERVRQVTESRRGRDPAFAGEDLVYIYQQPGTIQAIRRHNLVTGEEADIFVALPLERLAGLHARGDSLVFSLHDNQGRERIYRISKTGGAAEALTPEEKGTRLFERNPYLAADGSIWFARLRDQGGAGAPQSLYRFDPQAKKIALVYGAASGLVDRPIPSADGKSLYLQAYHLEGFDLAKVALVENPPPGPQHEQDLHHFLTGMTPQLRPAPTAAELSAVGNSVPYRALSTPATSLWPQYWIPEIAAAEEGMLLGITTSGNDPLEYHRYGATLQYDTRASFPTYRAFYENRSLPTLLHFEAKQYNDYLVSTGVSNRTAVYSGQAMMPIGDSFFSLGGAFQERQLFGSRSQSVVLFQSFTHNRKGQRPAAIDPNWGKELRLYAGVYPNARNEKAFVDLRPSAYFYFPGFRSSHSVSVGARAGITTNRLLASNYYLGGGLSVLNETDFVVRGYPIDTLLGQRIATANFAYTLPIAHPYRGWGTNPVFLQSLGLRFLADAGSSNYVPLYRNDFFYRYVRSKLGQEVLTGFGLDLVAKGTAFYHVPVTLAAGLHYGTRKQFGGDFVFFFGLNVGFYGNVTGAVEPRGESGH